MFAQTYKYFIMTAIKTKLLTKLIGTTIQLIPYKIIKEKIKNSDKSKILLLLLYVFLFILLTYFSYLLLAGIQLKTTNGLWVNKEIDINQIKFLQNLIILMITYNKLIIIINKYLQEIKYAEPTNDLIQYYKELLSTDKNRFNMYFYLFEKKLFDEKYNNLQYYEELLFKNEFWNNLENNKNREALIIKLHNNSLNIFKTILDEQIKNIPNSKLANDLKLIDKYPDKNPLFIYALFNEKEYIENLLNKIDFLEIVKENVDMYFNSLNINIKQFEKEPYDNAYIKTYPEELIIFYYIDLIDKYWEQQIKKNVSSQMEPIYLFLAENIIKLMPKLNDKQISTYRSQNYYLLSINKLLDNISKWIKLIISKNKNNYSDALELFIHNQYKILLTLTIAYNQDKVSKEWLIIEYTKYLRNIYIVLKFIKNDISISFYKLDKNILKKSIDEYIYRDFYRSSQNDIIIQYMYKNIQKKQKHTTFCIANSYHSQTRKV